MEKEYFQTIGGKIRLLRIMHGMNQRDFANIMHVTKSTVCRWERNQTEIDTKSLVKIADMFQVKLTLLLDEARPLK